MKLRVEQDSNITETEIVVRCRDIDPELENLINTIRLYGNTVKGKKDMATSFVDIADILYFETTDNRLFFYTDSDVYETQLKLYEIEERFSNSPFVRVGKSLIINLRKVTNIKNESNGRLMAELANGEKIIISRQYVPNIKQKLGI